MNDAVKVAIVVAAVCTPFIIVKKIADRKHSKQLTPAAVMKLANK